MLGTLPPKLSNHSSLSHTGNHWSLHEELYVTFCCIQKHFPIVGSCRIPQACLIAIKKILNQVVNSLNSLNYFFFSKFVDVVPVNVCQYVASGDSADN